MMLCHDSQAALGSKNYFAKLDMFSSDPMAGDAVDEWLSSPPLVTVSDPITWWSAMEAAGHPLARMALDFLSAPGIFAHNSLLVRSTNPFLVSHVHRC
jgi:hypothetical protein